VTTFSPAFDLACLSALEARAELIREVQNGLHSRPRSLKPWMLYDELGSRLFEQITTLPEYYPARTERSLLESTRTAKHPVDAGGRASLQISGSVLRPTWPA
jgi:uncharacterized SAM-dependent methyltransferase